MADIKYQLRKIGFPACVQEALIVIEQIIVNRHNSVISTSLQLANEIISEFIFYEIPSTTSKGKTKGTGPLRKLEELELLECLCNYFSCGNVPGPSSADNSLRAAVFLCLFPVGDGSRLPIFVRLASMVIATRSANILAMIGTWLQNSGPTSDGALALAQSIVSDYLILVPDARDHLHDLPLIAPEFTTCFLCAVSKLYGEGEKLPPKPLLDTIAGWAKTSLGICTAVAGLNKNVPVTPFLGLIRWCIMAPIMGVSETEDYSQLQLALMESLIYAPRERLVSSEQLAAFVPVVLNAIPCTPPERLLKTIERFTQIVIVLLRMGSVAGNIMILFQQMDKLPNNEFLENFRSCRPAVASAPFFRLPQRI